MLFRPVFLYWQLTDDPCAELKKPEPWTRKISDEISPVGDGKQHKLLENGDLVQ
jgi:hypothetical protein